MRTKLIGISGVVSAGKNELARILKDNFAQKSPNLSVIEIALATPLKMDINRWTIPEYGIDCLTTIKEQKELIRPFLVAHARIKRIQTKGTFYTNLAEKEIKQIWGQNPDTIILITDIRYLEYPEDESIWIKKLGGIIIHLERYSGYEIVGPANNDEKENDPKVKEISDYRILWETTKTQEERAKFVQPFINWFTD